MFSERNRKRMPNRKCFTNTLNKQKQEKPRFSWDSKLFSLKNVSSGENKLNEGILDLIITPITLAVIGRSCTEHKPTTHIILKFNFFYLHIIHVVMNACQPRTAPLNYVHRPVNCRESISTWQMISILIL